MRTEIRSGEAPQPSGTYSQGISVTAGARLVFLSGQTPRTPAGTLLQDASFADQARQALDNLQALANAADLTLDDAVKVTVYLRDMADKAVFDQVYAGYVSPPLPARAVVQSSFVEFALEVDAVLAR